MMVSKFYNHMGLEPLLMCLQDSLTGVFEPQVTCRRDGRLLLQGLLSHSTKDIAIL